MQALAARIASFNLHAKTDPINKLIRLAMYIKDCRLRRLRAILEARRI